ncbi:MAG: hypothetical protein LUB61_07595, partial [Eggerthellaceae bacterium]|nr:hypothetical protein [Eggerthellaceae bacterium]
ATPEPFGQAVCEIMERAGLADPLTSFSRAYDSLVGRITSRYPASELWCMTIPAGRPHESDRCTFTFRLRGYDIADYNRAIANAAGRPGARVADLAAFGSDYATIDGTHPTLLGMSQL